ncbi:MAG: LPS export ABC transporter permease LptG [Paracoccaceae bacterium]
MILHRYFARRFAVIFAGILGIFFLLMGLIDLVEQIRRFSPLGVDFTDVVGLTLLNIPAGLYNILPLIMILSTVALFIGLSRSSELVVTRASGRSALRALLAPLAVALTIGTLAVAMFNPIVAATSKRYTTLYEQYRNGGSDVLSLSSEGLWLRQGSAKGQTLIRAVRANSDGTTLYDATFLTYAPDFTPVRRIEAATATLTRGAWQLENVKEWQLAPDGTEDSNPEETATRAAQMSLPSTLTQERIRDSFGMPDTIPVWDLPAYIHQLEQAGFSARRHAVWLQMELARPLFLVAMVMIASAFTMRPARSGNTGLAVLFAVMLGFLMYYIRNFSQILGENGQIPIALAAWAPPVAAAFLATGLLLHMEDG